MQGEYPRDLVGYGRNPPHPRWPGGANVAVQIVLNYEEGGERCLLHGDGESEAFLSEIPGAVPWPGQRHMNMESIYEYGTRAGFWRLLRLFARRRIKVTVYAVGMALARHPEAAAAMVEAGHEVASHGWRWIDYQDVPEDRERQHIAQAVETITRLTGRPPVGWYTGRCGPNTRRLVVEHGGFLYDSDAYDDDLPHWVEVGGRPHLVIPYTLDANDMRFATQAGFGGVEDFTRYLCDSFDVLRREGEAGAPKMMSVGLHCRLAGRPGRLAALERFLDHVQRHGGAWICTREEIARHWHAVHPPAAAARDGQPA